ncbi:MAG: 4Fe-4S binding protein [Mycobacterium leprae]
MTEKLQPLVIRKRPKRRMSPTQWLRIGSQILFLLLTAYGVVRHRLGEAAGLVGPANQAPSVDALSPLGGLETLWQWATRGQLVSHVQLSSVLLLVATLLVVVLLGSAFCGWICPLGALQEWLYRLRARFLPWQLRLPARVDRILRSFRYVVLLVILLFSWSLAELVFADYCPWRAAWHLGSGEVAIGGAVILGLVVVGGLLIERFWCRYACPLGAILGIANKIAPVRLRWQKDACPTCNLCSKRCPMDIEVTGKTKVTDTTCMRCMECVDACPQPEALGVKLGARKLRTGLYGLIAAAVFGGFILLTMATGTWQSTPSNAAPQPSAATGLVDPLEIKGWRSLQEVIDLYGIPQDVLYRALALDPAATPPSTLLKDLEVVTQVRELVGAWQRGELK